MKSLAHCVGSLKLALLAMIMTIAACGCRPKSASEPATVVLYTSVDDPYVRPLVEQFERDTGIKVTLLTDAEASKSVGLTERLRAEKDHPQADVWWGNECFLTINLADDGVLTPYDSPSAADIPARYKDPDHRWAGSVIRVRTLVSAGPKNLAKAWTPPTRLIDLLRPEFKGRIALARPTAGTTGGHVAALYALWARSGPGGSFVVCMKMAWCLWVGTLLSQSRSRAATCRPGSVITMMLPMPTPRSASSMRSFPIKARTRRGRLPCHALSAW